MNKPLIKRRIRQFFARVNYYGIGYIFDYLGAYVGFKRKETAVERKMKLYPTLEGKERERELGKLYHAITGDRVDFKAPKTFTQKIQWSKLYDRDPLRTTLSDKLAVRQWVADKIGEEYLTPIIGVWKSFDDIDFTDFPKKFALKCTHGTACNIIVEDKEKFNVLTAKEKIDKWMGINYAYFSFELQYKDIKPRIIAEEYMENDGKDLYDYKFYCYGGKAKYIQFLSDRKRKLRMAYLDTNWNKLPFVHDHPMITENLPRPDNLDEMIRVAETLSVGFPYVRVDLYRLDDGTIRFGEMTFTPAGGGQNFNPSFADMLLGEDYIIN